MAEPVQTIAELRAAVPQPDRVAEANFPAQVDQQASALPAA